MTTMATMTSLWCSLLLVLTTTTLLVVVHADNTNNPTARHIHFMNKSGSKVNLFWINRWNNDERVLNAEEGVMFGAESAINSFVSHEFEAVELPKKSTNVCAGENGECRTAIFEVNSNDNQVITLYKDFTIEHKDDKVVAQEQAAKILKECKAEAAASESSLSPAKSLEWLATCVEGGLQQSIEKSNEEISFQSGIRTKLADKFDGYACADFTLNTTEAQRNATFMHESKFIKAQVLHERPSSQIHYMPLFVRDSECREIEKLGESSSSTELEGLTGSAASYPVPDSGVVSILAKRVLAYFDNYVKGADKNQLELEDILAIRYNAKNDNDDDDASPDQYLAHCDYGDCAGGEEYAPGSRIASLTLYCKTAEKGGSVTFPNAGLFVKPQALGAIFTSFVDLAAGVTDTGFTKHSGCPVLEGEAKTVTFFLRTKEQDKEKKGR